MRRRFKLFVVAFAVVFAFLRGASLPAADANPRTYEGTYRWHDQEPRKLKATFRATGDNTWDVKFRYRFGNRRGTYSGTAEGSLGHGELTGQVKPARGDGAYVFRGTWEKGVYRGTHYRSSDRDRKDPTGTLAFGPD